jgi:hypothetical protein
MLNKTKILLKLILLLIICTNSFAENKLTTSSKKINAKGLTKAGTGEKVYSYDYNLKIEGEYSEKFVLGHGDCGSDGGSFNDCKMDRGRVERQMEYVRDRHQWYKFSFYLDEEWDKDTTVSFAQVKVKNVRPPVWMLRVDYGVLKLTMDILGAWDSTCNYLLSFEEMKGKWNEVIIFANYSNKPTPWLKDRYLGLWINGKQKQIDNCDKWNLFGKEKSAFSRKGSTFSYGLYHSYVSNELNGKALKAGVDMKLKGWRDKGAGAAGAVSSLTNKPWEVDWPVKLQTKRMWFDNMENIKSEENIWNLEVK